jgi:two-component system sensor histidine kinase MprB
MTFRTRLVLAATTAVVVAILTASVVAFVAARSAVVSSVDVSLESTASRVLNGGVLDGDGAYGNVVQVVTSNGSMVIDGQLPVTPQVRRVASTQSGPFIANVTVKGVPMRMLVEPVPAFTEVRAGALAGPVLVPAALELGYPLTGVNSQLRRLGFELLLAALIGVVLAVVLGWLVGRTALVPLNDLTDSVEEVADTTDVSQRLDPGGVDELGRLRRAFNRLLGALERSQDAQRQLVLDASHELRTPLTSLRTNLEVIRRIDELSPEDREILVDDVLTQLGELTSLVGDLAELARGDQVEHARTVLRFDRVVQDAAAVAVTHGRGRGIEVRTTTSPTWVEARGDRLARAVGNLLDNALKWSPQGGTVEVTCADGAVTVRDHGPGIDADDLPHIFDRFYRSAGARALPGSGLGLAIVAQVVESEGGSVAADNAQGGGARFRLTLPTVPPPADASADDEDASAPGSAASEGLEGLEGLEAADPR